MDKLNVLLVCGSGASTGFMAASIRKAAKKAGVEMQVEARSEAEVDNYADTVNCIMLGPHLEYLLADLQAQFKDKDLKIAVCDKKYYSTLDGEAALNHILSLYKERQ
jgi:PTS system cellobiose-specific IIB component